MAAPKKTSKQKSKGAHPYKEAENKNVSQEFSHWTIAPHIGFNAFDGDFNSEMKHNVAVPNAGLSLEYAFTPIWSLGIDYMYDMYAVTGRTNVPGQDNADTLLYGHMHKVGAYLSLDLITLFFPRAKKRIISIQPMAGIGYAWYKNKIMFFDDARYHTGSTEPTMQDKYTGLAYLQMGMNVEFNLNRTIALGVRTTYNYFVNDFVDGRGYAGPQALASKNNDGIFDITLNMRFKIDAVKKTHVRNVSSFDTWKPEEKPQIQYVHDTVILRHDSVIMRERIIERAGKSQGNTYYVYFNNGHSKLDDRGLVTVQQAADRMKEDTTLYAVVTGYCDNTGSIKANYILGDKRADNVIAELQEEHGISSAHLYAAGLGKLVGGRSQAAYGPNRRAVIRLVDKATFNRMKGELEEKRANREDDVIDDEEEEDEYQPTPVKTVPLNESARHAKTNSYKNRGGEIITTEPSTTLSKLARKYYNNTYCWVYIYIANKDKIQNPNSLTPGIQLTIPELTEQEMRITKDQGLVLYGNARQIR